MAHQGKQLDDWTKRYIERLREVCKKSIRETAKEARVNKSTVVKYEKDGRRSA